MTTAADTMPTLREIEQGLRDRLAEVTQARTTEARARERAKEKVTEVAHQKGNDHSIGESLDDLLVELDLTPRPYRISRSLLVEYRQEVPASHMRDIRMPGGTMAFNAYGDVREACLFSTVCVTYEEVVPRDHEGCACDLPVDDTHVLLQPTAGVERVDVTPLSCGYNRYPHSQDQSEPNRCSATRAKVADLIATAHDDPLVQPCTDGHTYTDPHRHFVYANGDVTYSVRADYNPDPETATALPGWYVTGNRVGEPIPGTPVPVDVTRIQQCDIVSHPNRAVHVHVQFAGTDTASYSRDLHYGVEGEEVLLPGAFSRDADRVGGLLVPAVDVVQECDCPLHPSTGLHLHFDNAGGSVTYSDDLDYVSEESTRVPGVFSAEQDLIGGSIR